MTDATITRRRALAYAAVLAALPLDGLVACGVDAETPGPLLAGMRRDLRSAEAIGRVWLAAQTPAPGSPALLRGICGDERCEEFAGDPERARRVIAARHRKDFETGNLVSVRGWQLSATEVQLYGLLALQAQRPSA